MPGLRDEYIPDLADTFFEEDEFAMARDFEIVQGGANYQKVLFTTLCVWDTETLKNRLIVIQQGVFMGSVLCFISKSWFPVEPKPEQVIYSRKVGDPIMEGWRVVEITDAEECYELALDKLVA